MDPIANDILITLLWLMLGMLISTLIYMVGSWFVSRRRRVELDTEDSPLEVIRVAPDIGYMPDVDARKWRPGRARYLQGTSKRLEIDAIRDAIQGAMVKRDRVRTELVHAPQIVDVKPVGRLRLMSVVDELGEWIPDAHEQVQPTIIGDVLAWRKWKTIRPVDLGFVAA
jgi:hypothetical protein